LTRHVPRAQSEQRQKSSAIASSGEAKTAVAVNKNRILSDILFIRNQRRFKSANRYEIGSQSSRLPVPLYRNSLQNTIRPLSHHPLTENGPKPALRCYYVPSLRTVRQNRLRHGSTPINAILPPQRTRRGLWPQPNCLLTPVRGAHSRHEDTRYKQLISANLCVLGGFV
jgi:hypothetical protein